MEFDRPEFEQDEHLHASCLRLRGGASSWAAAKEDPLWLALAALVDEQRAAAEKRHREIEEELKRKNPEREVYLWEVRNHAGKDEKYRQHATEAAGMDALLRRYEDAAEMAESRGKSLDEQRTAGEKALATMAGKLKSWIEGGKKYVALSEEERDAIDHAGHDWDNYQNPALPVHYPAGTLADAMDRRGALKVMAGTVGLGAGIAAFSATQLANTPDMTPETLAELSDINAKQNTLINDKQAWTPEKRRETLKTYQTLTSRENNLTQRAPLPEIGISVGGGVAVLAAIKLMQLLSISKRDKESVQEVTQHLRTIGGVMGEVMQKEQVQQASGSSRSA